MKFITTVTFGLILVAPAAFADSDREEIKAAMECFYQWDLHGGKDNSSQCISDTVLYHRVDADGNHSYGTPPLDNDTGKGAEAVIHNSIR